jgi:hypothetical protein
VGINEQRPIDASQNGNGPLFKMLFHGLFVALNGLQSVRNIKLSFQITSLSRPREKLVLENTVNILRQFSLYCNIHKK